ncbi:MAG: hypothetical protein GF408_00910 [Candidatus Omnitrophica bacterium]|nr:hypothetical protein [Candidatus Omnitrophota bacterium]
MKKLVTIMLVAAFAATALPAQAAFAKGYYGCKDKDHKMDLDDKFYKKASFILKNQDELGLSDAEIDRVKALKIKTKKFMIDQKAKIKKIKVDIWAELMEDDTNIDKVNGLIDDKYDLKAEKAKYLVNSYVVLKNTLTDDQMKKMKALWKKEKCDY